MENEMNLQARLGGGTSDFWVKDGTKKTTMTNKQFDRVQSKGYRAKKRSYPVDDVVDIILMIAGYFNIGAATAANIKSLVGRDSRSIGEELFEFGTIGEWATRRLSGCEDGIEVKIPIYRREVTGETAEGVPDFVDGRIRSYFEDKDMWI